MKSKKKLKKEQKRQQLTNYPIRDYPENSQIWYGSPPNHYKYPHGWIKDEARELKSNNRVIIKSKKLFRPIHKTLEIMEDKIIKCIDCHKDFIFTLGEQEFFEEKGYITPKRCKDCRIKRKAEKRSRCFLRE